MRYILLLFISALVLWSAPAFDQKRQFRQPDGTTFNGRVCGDEFLNWVETDQGDILLYATPRQRFEHAVIDAQELRPSGVAYGDSISRGQVPPVDKAELKKLWKQKRSEAQQQYRITGPQRSGEERSDP